MLRRADSTASRRAEALGLTWRALDVDGDTPTLNETQLVNVRAKDARELKLSSRLKSESAHRTIPLDATSATVLRAHRETQRLERSVLGWSTVDLDLVFTKLDGSPSSPGGISQHFQVKRKQAGLNSTTVNTYQRHKVETAERAAAEMVSGLIDDAPVSKRFANGGAGGAQS